MKRAQLCLVLAAALVLASASGRAQETMNLTVDQAIAIGLENSKSLHSSRMNVEGTQARSNQAFAEQLPTLKFGGSYTRLSQVPPFEIGPYPPILTSPIEVSPALVNNYNLRMTLQQPLFTGFRLSNSSDMAGRLSEAAGFDYERDRAELQYAVRSAYWGLYKAIEFKKVIDEVVEQMKSHLRDVQNFAAQGIATKNDVLKVEVQLSNSQLTQIDAQNNVELARIALNNTIGLPLTTRIELASAIQKTERTFDSLPSLLHRAETARPEIQGMDSRVKASESAVSMARSGWFPQIYLTGNYYYARPNQRIFPAVDQFRDTWDVSLSVSLDIWNWGSTIQQTHEAQAQLAQAHDALGQLRDGISLEVTQAYLSFNESGQRTSVADQGVVQAEENLRITNEKYKAGLALNSDVLDAEVALLQAKWNSIQALVDHELAGTRLQKAIAAEMQ